MPINYYANVDLNQNQLLKPRIQNEANNTAAGTGVPGQIYYDTTLSVLKVWNTSWVEIGVEEGVTNVKTTNSTYINMTPTTNTAGNVTVTASLSASGTPSASTFLNGDNVWATVTQEDTTYDLTATGSTNGTVNVNLIAGGSGSGTDSIEINGSGTTTVTRTGNIITISSADSKTGTVTGLTQGAGIDITASASSPTVAVDYLTSNNVIAQAGALGTPATSDTIIYQTGTTVKKSTIASILASVPAGADTTYTLPVTNGSNPDLVLTAGGSGSGTDIVNLNGSSNVTVTGATLNTVNFDLGTNISVAGSITATAGPLTVGSTGVSSFSGDVTVPTTPAQDASAASKAYVDQSNVGQSIFQGGYNASTNTPDLDSSPSSLIKLGWFWAVTDTGDFFSEEVQPGDLIYANQDNPGATFANWTVVQSGQDIATAGASDGNTTKGIAGFFNGHFDVTSNGFVTSEIFSGGANVGIVPSASGAGADTYLQEDGTWSVPTGTIYNLTAATSSALGGIKIGYTENGKNYPVELSGEKAFVNVPWTDAGDTTYSAGTGLTLNGTVFNVNVQGTVQSEAPESVTAETDRTYSVQVDANDDLVVNVPWVNTNTQAVSSVARAAGTTSTGNAITVSPTTGAVKVKSNAYNGGANIGHVPSGGVQDKYLDGEGNWVDPFQRQTNTINMGKTVGTTAATAYGLAIEGLPMIQLIDSVTGETVFADVDRHLTADTFTVTFGTAPPNNVYAVLSAIKEL
mgnify:CR=1 FL=1|jgi:hypothetical protein